MRKGLIKKEICTNLSLYVRPQFCKELVGAEVERLEILPIFKSNSYYIMKFLPLYLLLFVTSLSAQTREQGPWWPNPLWGADDQAGASNWITPEKIVEASQWIKTGKTYELGHVYDQNMFVPDNRVFKLFIPSFPTYGPEGKDRVVFNDESPD